MLSKALEMSKRTITDIFFWSMLLRNSLGKWSSAASVEWSFLFPLCRWCMTLFEWRKLLNCKWAALSHTLDKIGSSDIGLVFAGSSVSPDLRIKTISAFFHGSGKVLKVKELIRLVIMGAITGELSFRILALTLSQPGVLDQIPLCHECQNCVPRQASWLSRLSLYLHWHKIHWISLQEGGDFDRG